MQTDLARSLKESGPLTADELAQRLTHFDRAAVAFALEALADQGVLERVAREDGETAYRYTAPERYVQIDRDVVHDPARVAQQGARPGEQK